MLRQLAWQKRREIPVQDDDLPVDRLDRLAKRPKQPPLCEHGKERIALHARMPVVLTGDARQDWLSERAFAPADFAALAKTAPDHALSLHRVSSDVNRVAVDDERLVRPVSAGADQADFFGDLLG